ncbi:purine-nucleoside phosphorylase, partial [Candidatus Roizmanbacteria bacterium CG03_land_8_20_14_0_80_39_12]
KICVEHEIPFHEGSYVYYHGPNFETPADKMALRFLGADVVGMSTVPETLAARALNIDVLGLVFVTNLAFVKHNHKEVLAEADKASGMMKILLKNVV